MSNNAAPDLKIVERLERMTKRLAEVSGEDVRFGYLGNCNFARPGTPAYRDDRSWCVFLPHPGRVGTSADRIGGHGGDELEALIPLVAGALKLATWQANRRHHN